MFITVSFNSVSSTVLLLLHRMGWVGREHSGSSGPTSLPKQGHSRVHGTGLHPDGSGLSPVKETSQPCWATCSSAWPPAEVLPHIQVELPVLQVLLTVSCPVAGHHQTEPGSIL